MADLAQQLGAALGEPPVGWAVRSVDHRPGRPTTTAYDVRVPGGGQRVVVVSGEQVWRFPHDPWLPGLPHAVDERQVRRLLGTCGLDVPVVQVRVRSYRPRRRAVVEVQAGELRLFLKVVRPPLVAPLHERHRLLRAGGLPVPRSLGHRDDGVLVTEALPGQLLRTRLRAGGAPVGAHDVVGLLDRLPAQVCELPARGGWTEHVAHYAAMVAATLPEQAERGAQLADRVAQRTAGVPADQPAHGDLHEAQLLVDGAGITGLLDVDAVGPGRRADDLACLLAHAQVLALEPGVADAAQAWYPVLSGTVDGPDLRARVAGVLVSLATGPYRVQAVDWPEATRVRLDLAEAWLEGQGPPVASSG